MVAAREGVKGFVIQYFQSLGARIEEVEERSLPASTRSQTRRLNSKELRCLPGCGSPVPTNPRRSRTTSRSRRQWLNGSAEAELIGPGSHRLQQVVESVRKIGRATRAGPAGRPGLELEEHSSSERSATGLFTSFACRIEFHAAQLASRLFMRRRRSRRHAPVESAGRALSPARSAHPASPDDGESPSSNPRQDRGFVWDRLSRAARSSRAHGSRLGEGRPLSSSERDANASWVLRRL